MHASLQSDLPIPPAMRRAFGTLLMTWLACFASGCCYFNNLNGPEQFERGYTLVLPGIEGPSHFNSDIAQGLRDGGVDTAIEVHDWTSGNFLNFLSHLRNDAHHRREAESLAAEIVAYQDAYPGRPVHLVGMSGGGGMALLTLEQLPADRRVTSVMLLAPAISPQYDLRQVLDRTEYGIWNFSSLGDIFILGAGTSVAGTIDGKHSPSAGMVGFRPPADDPDAYRGRVREIRYSLDMALDGNLGGHMGTSSRSFIKKHVATRLASLPDPNTSGERAAEQPLPEASQTLAPGQADDDVPASASEFQLHLSRAHR